LFPQSKEISAENIQIFIADVKSGNLEHVVKSESLASKNEADGVMNIIYTSFKEMVLDREESVLVNFHLPWCGFCKSIWPTYKKLSEVVKSMTKDIIIAAFDASKNDIPFPSDHDPNLWPQKYPHIALFLADSKVEPVPFVGNMTLENLLIFLEEYVPTFKVTPDPEVVDPEKEGNQSEHIYEEKADVQQQQNSDSVSHLEGAVEALEKIKDIP